MSSAASPSASAPRGAPARRDASPTTPDARDSHVLRDMSPTTPDARDYHVLRDMSPATPRAPRGPGTAAAAAPVSLAAADPVPHDPAAPSLSPGQVPHAMSPEPSAAPPVAHSGHLPDGAGLAPWSPEPDPTAFPEPEPEPVLEVAPEPPPRVVPPPATTRGGVGCHGSVPCQRLLVLGGVTAGLGVASVITGAALVARRDSLDPADPTSLITYRPAGAAFLAVGSGLLTTWLLTLLAAVRAGKLAQRRRARDAGPGGHVP